MILDRLLDMRGDERRQPDLFLYGTLEERIPENHPLQPVREMTDIALEALSPRFDELYAANGRLSIPPEQLLRALLLQALYSVRSERMLVEQLEYNLLFRWFVGLGMGMNDRAWNHAVLSKNRERLLAGEVAEEFAMRLLSEEHFTVDDTLIEAWASHKSFRPKGGSDKDGEGGFRGSKRRNDTHRSSTDPEAKLYRKGRGQEAKLSYLGYVLIDNRHGLAVDATLTEANGRAEREAALEMEARLPGEGRMTLGADKGYDTRDFVEGLRELDVTRHTGYEKSQKKRKLVEQVFGWIKTTGGLRKTHHRGREKVAWMFTFAAAAYNLVRIRNLLEATA